MPPVGPQKPKTKKQKSFPDRRIRTPNLQKLTAGITRCCYQTPPGIHLCRCRGQSSGFIGVFGCDDWDLNYHCAIPAYGFQNGEINVILYMTKDGKLEIRIELDTIVVRG